MDINRKSPSALVTLSVSTAFANYWILSRLSRLHRDHPGIDLRLQVVDKESDLEHEDVSLSIRRGTGGWKGYASSCIAEEEIIPVASASYVDRYGKPDTIEELARNQFNHLEEPYRPRPKWRDWIAIFDFDYIDN
jgi:DNA-binding transcriptional LysR family regulator